MNCTKVSSRELFEKYLEFVVPNSQSYYVYCRPVFGTIDQYQYSSSTFRREIGFCGNEAAVIFASNPKLMELYPATLKDSFFAVLPDGKSAALKQNLEDEPLHLTRQDTPAVSVTMSALHEAIRNSAVKQKSEFEGDSIVRPVVDHYQYDSEDDDDAGAFDASEDDDDFDSANDCDDEFALLVQQMKANGASDAEIRDKKLSIKRAELGVSSEKTDKSWSHFFPGKNTPCTSTPSPSVASKFSMTSPTVSSMLCSPCGPSLNNSRFSSFSAQMFVYSGLNSLQHPSPDAPSVSLNQIIPPSARHFRGSSSVSDRLSTNEKIVASSVQVPESTFSPCEKVMPFPDLHGAFVSRLEKSSLIWNSDDDTGEACISRQSPIEADDDVPDIDFSPVEDIDLLPCSFPRLIDPDEEDLGFEFQSYGDDENDLDYISDEDESSQESEDEVEDDYISEIETKKDS